MSGEVRPDPDGPTGWVMEVAGRIRPVRMNGECIEWTTNLTRGGYPRIGVSKRQEVYVHRLIAEMKFGDISGLLVMHSCDNPPCVNPEHLNVGTQADNMQDCAARKRIKSPFFPEGHPQRTPA